MAIGAEHTQMSNHEDWSLRGVIRLCISLDFYFYFYPILLQSSVVARRPIRKSSSQGRTGSRGVVSAAISVAVRDDVGGQ